MAYQNLYFIAIIPPQEICNEVTAFKHDLAARFNSVSALKVMPHLTLKSPFKLDSSGHDSLVRWFHQLPVTSPYFEIRLKNFGAFPNKKSPVIFIQPELNSGLLSLQESIMQLFQLAFPEIEISQLELNFKPHITIAYRDLTPARFELAWKEYSTKEYSTAFTVNEFYLLQHTGKAWKVIENLTLKK